MRRDKCIYFLQQVQVLFFRLVFRPGSKQEKPVQIGIEGFKLRKYCTPQEICSFIFYIEYWGEMWIIDEDIQRDMQMSMLMSM